MRTLWILNHYAAGPGESTAGVRHYLLARGLQEHGWRTVIVAASTQHYTGAQRLSGWRLTRTEAVDGITHRWLRARRYAGNGIGRILNMGTYFLLALTPIAWRKMPRPDAVLGSSVHPLAALAGAWVAARRGVPFYFEIRDLWPETLIQMGAIGRDSRPARVLRWLERYLCARAERVIVTMPFAHEYLERQGVPPGKTVWISNGVDLASFPDPTPRTPEESFTFTYFGALGNANALPTLIDGFAVARQDADFSARARLRFIGDGPERPALEARVEELGLGGVVTVEQPIPKQEIPAIAAASDVLVVALLPLALYDYGISLNKLFEYMAAARPILFAGQARGNPVEASGGGIVTDCDADQVAAGMLEMMRADRDLLDEWGSCNRKHVEAEFSYAALATRLAHVLST